MSRLTLPQRIFVIEIMTKHDSSKFCKIQFKYNFGKTHFFRTKGNSEIGCEFFFCDNVRRDILNSATAVEKKAHIFIVNMCLVLGDNFYTLITKLKLERYFFNWSSPIASISAELF